MNIQLFDNPEAVCEAEFEMDLQKLPKWRQTEVLKYRFLIDRVLSTKAFLLLKKGLLEEYGIDGFVEFAYEKNGKPILKNSPEIFFNISHCKKGVLCVLDNSPVGCDIEEVPDILDMDLCKQCFNIDEVQRIITDENPRIAFAKYWTMKEAFLKLSGEGLVNDISSVLTDKVLQNVCFNTVISPEKKWVYTICQKSDGDKRDTY